MTPYLLFFMFFCFLVLCSVREYRLHQKPQPMTQYQEICAIKDRLYRDVVRLQTLQGVQTANENVARILSDLAIIVKF